MGKCLKNYKRLVFRSPSKQSPLGKDIQTHSPVKVSKWRIRVFLVICCVTPILIGCCFVTSGLTTQRLTASTNDAMQLRTRMNLLRSGHLRSYLHSTALARCPKNFKEENVLKSKDARVTNMLNKL